MSGEHDSDGEHQCNHTPSQPVSRGGVTCGWFIIKCVGYIFSILIIGLLGALVAGGLEHHVRRWAWVAGAALAAIGYPLGWVKVSFGKVTKGAKPAAKSPDAEKEWRQAGWLHAIFAGIILGLIAGVLVGFVVLIILLSLALSPFTPDSWREGLAVGYLHVSSASWFPLKLLGITAASFVAAGVILCMVFGVQTLKPGQKREN